MALWDQGNGCPCGLRRECDCKGNSADNNHIFGYYTKNYTEEHIKWIIKTCTEITKAGGSAEIITDIPFDILDKLVKNNIFLTYKK